MYDYETPHKRGNHCRHERPRWPGVALCDAAAFYFERPIGRVSLHLLSVLANGDYKAIIRLSNGGNLMITPLREAQSLGGQKRLGETLAV